MDVQEKQLNRSLIVGWAVIVIVLFFAYIGEVLKGERTFLYAVIFMTATGLPALACWIAYRKNPLNRNLRYGIVAGYYFMYLFVMVSGSTILVFTYILPLLSLLILYHQPKLILLTGAVTMIVNIAFIVMRVMDGEVTLTNSKDAEIQIALLLLCFGGCYLASKLYDDINARNKRYVAMLDEKSRQIQQMTFQTIETIANTIDAKDDYTQGHSRRVSDYAAEIAARMGMSEEEVMNVRYIALLHDIGKIGVPDSVLNKPGRLTDAEYELMKQHTVIGGEILKDIGMLEGLDVGAKYHHERYDGKGYPNGLKGEEIPLIARIICLADAYDAMTSNRIYRRHLPRKVVLEEIRRCRGTQFDPKVTDAFLDYLEKELTEYPQQDAGNPDTLASTSTKLLQKIVTDRNRQAAEGAERDELTQVYNRSAGERHVVYAMQQGFGCLILLDLDDMRMINRQYGFRRGDQYLKVVTSILKEISGDIILARFSGDEFLGYIPGLVEVEEIRGRIEKVLEEVRRFAQTDEMFRDLSVSAGITIYDKEGKDLQQLLLEADKALYHVKQESRNSYYFYLQIEDRSDDFSKVDMKNLMEAIRRKDSFSDQTVLEQKDFLRMYEFVTDVAKGSNKDIKLIMLTAKPKNEGSMGIEERDQVMHMVEQAILRTVKDIHAITRYSSVQRIIMLEGSEETDAGRITDAVLKDFYRMYDKKDIELYYDIASIQEGKMEG